MIKVALEIGHQCGHGRWQRKHQRKIKELMFEYKPEFVLAYQYSESDDKPRQRPGLYSVCYVYCEQGKEIKSAELESILLQHYSDRKKARKLVTTGHILKIGLDYESTEYLDKPGRFFRETTTQYRAILCTTVKQIVKHYRLRGKGLYLFQGDQWITLKKPKFIYNFSPLSESKEKSAS